MSVGVGHSTVKKVAETLDLDYEDATAAVVFVIRGLTNEILAEYRPDLLLELAEQHKMSELPKTPPLPDDSSPPEQGATRGSTVWIAGVAGQYDRQANLVEVTILSPIGHRIGSKVWVPMEAVFERSAIRGWFEKSIHHQRELLDPEPDLPF